MEFEEKKDAGYEVAVSGIRGMIQIIVVVCIAICLIFLARETYKLGYAVFNQKPVDKGEGREVQVTITEEMSVMGVGKVLKEAGLLKEDLLVFQIQEMISDYQNKLVPGTYNLRTGMTTDEMLRVMAGEDKENPAVDTKKTQESTEKTN